MSIKTLKAIPQREIVWETRITNGGDAYIITSTALRDAYKIYKKERHGGYTFLARGKTPEQVRREAGV